MDHHPVADINAHMGCATGVVGFLEEDQVSGLCLTLRDNVAFSHQTVGRLPAYIPAIAAVVDDPAYKTGAVKTGTRRAAAPNIVIISGFSPTSHRACDFHRTRRSIVSHTHNLLQSTLFVFRGCVPRTSPKPAFRRRAFSFSICFLLRLQTSR